MLIDFYRDLIPLPRRLGDTFEQFAMGPLRARLRIAIPIPAWLGRFLYRCGI